MRYILIYSRGVENYFAENVLGTYLAMSKLQGVERWWFLYTLFQEVGNG